VRRRYCCLLRSHLPRYYYCRLHSLRRWDACCVLPLPKYRLTSAWRSTPLLHAVLDWVMGGASCSVVLCLPFLSILCWVLHRRLLVRAFLVFCELYSG
jgi:hypothetical protein